MSRKAAVVTVGKKYTVRFDDCCIRGEFTATLTRIREISGPENGELIGTELTHQEADSGWGLGELWFDNGVHLAECGCCEFDEVE